MVTEIAIIEVRPGQEAAFATAFQNVGHELLATTPGCLSVKMYRSGESSRFVGVNEWESWEAHLDNFRGTDRYTRYGEALRPYLSAPPVVERFTDVTSG
ncbi:putative quinol monooxygenase [Streptomyces sp. NPDC058653]|uniref:putative quinol monooxygenase n=1 Tax=Streptomyces sp. NPDC058653 TaxID=3346576 RepID=UPI003650EEAA